MLRKELIKAVKHLELVARRAVNDQLAGQYQSVFKGRGMDFTDVREYQPGDDIRVIDWNVSARMNDLYIKQFVEERELTVLLLVDASGSQTFGTYNRRKQETAAELAALIAFSAIKNNDRVGLITFTDQIEAFIPPKKGRKHVLRVITEILDFTPERSGTDIPAALEYLSRITSKRALTFVISDFQDTDFETSLSIANRRHEIIPLVLEDPMETELPDMGLVPFEDPETGEIFTVDTSSKRVRSEFRSEALRRKKQLVRTFRKHKVDHIPIRTDASHIEPLVQYFRTRSKRY
ncbi:DUF58 domain-containing protein [Persicimonas caeni]|uniref:DUF58 domain-containing protein n=1 Tax=Persicimonas caeni TaxID=2292766 RepID=A0A4Y6Q0V0_PERCE|nr:DUF58 domain-containing protein [Persicimonas caeni]QDG54110.1 DUF58 domain-containing protein [Persicimonas caeni]QED35331.1 DUF58 domain-containing protein [Persicimonas caeni]